MLDIIIPVYNNYNGLAATIASFGVKNRILYHFIIIDDASTIDYTPIINFYSQWFDIQYYKLNDNKGPGVARNIGLKHTSHEFVTFMDAGDELCNTFSFLHGLSCFSENSDLLMLSPSHAEVDFQGNFSPVWEGNNRVHGKIYKRQFLEQYNITFGEEQSKCNEDIGFNICCRLICAELNLKYNINTIFNLQQDLVMWVADDPDSLTNKNNCQFYYKEQNLGLAQNFIHGLNIAINAGVRPELYLEEVYSVFASMWKFYVSTVNERPEFTDYALTGAYYYYINCFKLFPFNAELLLSHQNFELNCINWLEDPFSSKLFIFSILDFIELLEKKEKEINGE